MIVVDASALVTALGDDGDSGARVRQTLAGEDLVAPAIVDLEVLSAWRRLVISGDMTAARADYAVERLAELPITRAPMERLLARIWTLRDDLTPYDAAYVALAEQIDAPLLTADSRLANSPGPACRFRLIDS